MDGEQVKRSIFELTTIDEKLLRMLSDALGFEVTEDTMLSSDEESRAHESLQARLDVAAEQIADMLVGGRDGVETSVIDTEAHLALIQIQAERCQST